MMQAVGMYLKILRERRNLSVMDIVLAMRDLAPEIDTNPTYIWRIEHGKIESPGARLLLAFTRVVEGSLEDVADLLLNRRATADDGYRRAEEWFDQTQHALDKQAASTESEVRVVQIGDSFRALETDELIDIVIELSTILREKREHQRRTQKPDT